MQLQQRFATGEMGFRGTLQQFLTPHVRFGVNRVVLSVLLRLPLFTQVADISLRRTR